MMKRTGVFFEQTGGDDVESGRGVGGQAAFIFWTRFPERGFMPEAAQPSFMPTSVICPRQHATASFGWLHRCGLTKHCGTSHRGSRFQNRESPRSTLVGRLMPVSAGNAQSGVRSRRAGPKFHSPQDTPGPLRTPRAPQRTPLINLLAPALGTLTQAFASTSSVGVLLACLGPH